MPSLLLGHLMLLSDLVLIMSLCAESPSASLEEGLLQHVYLNQLTHNLQ